MKRFLRSISIAFFILISVSSLSGCSDEPEKDITIRIANVSSMGPAQGIVMDKKGFLRKKIGKDYKIESSTVGMADEILPKLQNEKYDLVFTQYPSLGFLTQDQLDNYVMIANLGNGDRLNLIANKGINNIKDLDGKTIGLINYHYSYAVLLSKTLKQHGLDIAENGGTVKIRYGNIIDLFKAFSKGEIDAFFILSQIGGNFKTILTYEEMAYQGAPAMCLLVRKSFLEDNPELIEKTLEATIESTQWIEKNPTEAAQHGWELMQKNSNYLPFRMEDLAKQYSKTKWTVYPNLEFLNEIWSYMEKTGRKPVPMNKVVDFQYLDNALKEYRMKSIETVQERDKN